MKIEETMLMTRLYDAEQGKKTAFEDGRKAEYDAFWDVYQQDGKRENYNGAFFGTGWTNDTFVPKYDIKPIGSNTANIFRNSKLSGSLTEHLIRLGVSIDFSLVTSVASAFYISDLITEIPELDLSSCLDADSAFYRCTALEKISLIISENLKFNKTFDYCSALRELTIKGTIGKSDFKIADSIHLSADSIRSIVNSLSVTTTGLTATFSLAAVNNAFETSEGAADGSTSEEWTTLIATKPNWTIALA